MRKNVLVVDDQQRILFALKEGLEKFDDTFRVTLAGDGVAATEKLRNEDVSLIVTDLKMPRMDGFSLLAHVMEYYPDIPVIMITGFSTPEMKGLAQEGGAVAYLEKPFDIEDLCRKVLTVLRRESDGGTLHGVSSGMFLQLIKLEKKTCTIRLTDRRTGKNGVLFFREGHLIDARVNGDLGEAAAHRIFAWDDVALTIQNECPQGKKRIQADLQAILLEALRRKDEGEQQPPRGEIPGSAQEANPSGVSEPETESLRRTLREATGGRFPFDEIRRDASWTPFTAFMERVGDLLQLGPLGLAHFEWDGEPNLLVLPGPEPTVVPVAPKAPRDRLIQALTQNRRSSP